MAGNMLISLPLELLNMIIGQITSRKDLKHLCEVCSSLHHVTTPHLYRSIILSTSKLSLRDLAASLQIIPRKYLMYTREVGFRAEFQNPMEPRCVHRYHVHSPMLGPTLTYEYGNEDTEEDPFLNLMCILGCMGLPDDQLRSFRWELGTCIVPVNLLWGNDSPIKNQKQIQSISIITAGSCGIDVATHYFVDLVQFKEIQSLDWRGLNRWRDFETVKECITAHGHQLKSLTLDLLSWDHAERRWKDGFIQHTGDRRKIPNNFFAQGVLNIEPKDKRLVFPILQILHLSAVSFYNAGIGMKHAFNIENLKSLKLRNCPGSLDWLQLILNSGKKLTRITSLELAFDINSLRNDELAHITQTISEFIQNFNGLKSLNIILPEPIDWVELTEKISHHHNLQRLVTHHVVDRGGHHYIDGDIPPLEQLEEILQRRELTCFGTSMYPEALTSHFEKMQPRPVLSLIHLRISGVVLERLNDTEQHRWFSRPVYNYKYGEVPPDKLEEMYKFAKWVFSKEGIPQLQILAWGDFTYDGRYAKYNLILCRSGNSYDVLTSADLLYWEIIQDNKDILLACPLDNIMD